MIAADAAAAAVPGPAASLDVERMAVVDPDGASAGVQAAVEAGPDP